MGWAILAPGVYACSDVGLSTSQVASMAIAERGSGSFLGQKVEDNLQVAAAFFDRVTHTATSATGVFAFLSDDANLCQNFNHLGEFVLPASSNLVFFYVQTLANQPPSIEPVLVGNYFIDYQNNHGPGFYVDRYHIDANCMPTLHTAFSGQLQVQVAEPARMAGIFLLDFSSSGQRQVHGHFDTRWCPGLVEAFLKSPQCFY